MSSKRDGYVPQSSVELLSACASGCHQSTADKAARNGTPDDANFDLVPLRSDKPSSAELNALRDRQLDIYDRRDEIYRQVISGAMPLKGLGDDRRKSWPGKQVLFTPFGECTRGETVANIDSTATRELLREWLACGAPFVEVAAKTVRAPETGQFGDRYPLCDVDMLEPRFENAGAPAPSLGPLARWCIRAPRSKTAAAGAW